MRSTRGSFVRAGLIVEGTAGNTGIGLTVVGNALGMKTVIVIPETQSQEKKDTLRSLGATLVEVPAAPYRSDNNYVKVAARMAERLAREHPHGAIFANQFDNVANRDVHVRTTGPEIWAQTDGKVDGFVSAVGTGGTLAGVAIALRERRPDVAIAIADVPGAALYSYYTTGELKAEGSSITEGIGQGRITANLEGLIGRRSLLHRRPGKPRRRRWAWSMTRASMSAFRRASTSPGRSASPASSGRERPSSPCSATPRPAISRGCSTRNSCAPRDWRRLTGLNNRRVSNPTCCERMGVPFTTHPGG